MKQRWNHIFFLHGRASPDILQKYLPFELDLFEGRAILSIVPFKMDCIRLGILPPAPFFSHLWEVNLRTYVKVGQKTGVYFFTLDSDARLACFIANHFFHLPYRLARIHAHVDTQEYYFHSQRSLFSFETSFRLTGRKKKQSLLDEWATNRNSLFTCKKGNIYEGRVKHDPWPLEEIENLVVNDHFSNQIPIHSHFDPQDSSYSRSLHVSFTPFQKIN